jgi:nucleotide-binding universal stress UspA family protein
MKPLMLATDGSPTATKATSMAIELARALGSELVIVSVWQLSYGGYTGLGFTAPIPNENWADLGEGQARKVAAEAAARAEEVGVEARTIVLRGMIVEEICLAAEKVGPELLVVGSHGWRAMKRTLFGSVSAGVLHRAACPVLVVPCDVAAENGAAAPKAERARA